MKIMKETGPNSRVDFGKSYALRTNEGYKQTYRIFQGLRIEEGYEELVRSNAWNYLSHNYSTSWGFYREVQVYNARAQRKDRGELFSVCSYNQGNTSNVALEFSTNEKFHRYDLMVSHAEDGTPMLWTESSPRHADLLPESLRNAFFRRFFNVTVDPNGDLYLLEGLWDLSDKTAGEIIDKYRSKGVADYRAWAQCVERMPMLRDFIADEVLGLECDLDAESLKHLLEFLEFQVGRLLAPGDVKWLLAVVNEFQPKGITTYVRHEGNTSDQGTYYEESYHLLLALEESEDDLEREDRLPCLVIQYTPSGDKLVEFNSFTRKRDYPRVILALRSDHAALDLIQDKVKMEWFASEDFDWLRDRFMKLSHLEGEV
jgi:hypothetical protein